MNDDSKTLIERRVCADCNELFTLTGQELRWFSRRGLQTPRRCGPCRDERRKERAQAPGGIIPRLTTRPQL